MGILVCLCALIAACVVMLHKDFESTDREYWAMLARVILARISSQLPQDSYRDFA